AEEQRRLFDGEGRARAVDRGTCGGAEDRGDHRELRAAVHDRPSDEPREHAEGRSEDLGQSRGAGGDHRVPLLARGERHHRHRDPGHRAHLDEDEVEYTITKFLHVTFAIIAVGWNASYGFWLARAAREPQ